MADQSNYSKIIEKQIESVQLSQQNLPELIAEYKPTLLDKLLAKIGSFLKTNFPDKEARDNISVTVQVVFWFFVAIAVLVSVYKIWKYLEAKNLDKSQKITIDSRNIKKNFFKWSEMSLNHELDQTLVDKNYSLALRFRWMLFLKRVQEKKYLTPIEFFYETKQTTKSNSGVESKNFQFWLFYYKGAFDPGMGDLMTYNETDRYLESLETVGDSG